MKVFEMFSQASNAIKVGKEVIEALGVLLEDNDHNGTPDICDHLQKIVDLVVVKAKAHFALMKSEFGFVKAELLEVKAKLDKVRAGK